MFLVISFRCREQDHYLSKNRFVFQAPLVERTKLLVRKIQEVMSRKLNDLQTQVNKRGSVEA